ncbi:MAG: nucleotidyltransferase [Ignavibacteriaceae bacterium]|nr:nucleotidyltransferase [Ignavibacteriaceae bacterium]
MNNQTKKFLEVLDALQKEAVDYVLIGGFAVVLHGYLRFTEGVELFIRNNDSNLEKLRAALKQVFKDQSIDEITVPEIEQYAVIRYGTTDDFYIDIIGNIGEAFSLDDIKSEEIEVQGTKVRIATLESLYKLKEKTYRAVDQADLLFLAERIRNKTI